MWMYESTFNPRTPDGGVPIQPIGERSVAPGHAPSVGNLTIIATRGPTVVDRGKQKPGDTYFRAGERAGIPVSGVRGIRRLCLCGERRYRHRLYPWRIICYGMVILPRAVMHLCTSRRAALAPSRAPKPQGVFWNASRGTWKSASGARKRCKVARLLDAGRDCVVTLTPIRV
jgi:hypothetical protein